MSNAACFPSSGSSRGRRVVDMGLDTVELVMAIEEEFGLQIPDERAAKIFTVGDMHQYLVSELARLGRPEVEVRVYERLTNTICRQLGIDAKEVIPQARFVEDLRLD